VAEVPESTRTVASAGIQVEGSGELWVGYGVIEAVTEDVPLSPLLE
jgi:hypothetical protein